MAHSSDKAERAAKYLRALGSSPSDRRSHPHTSWTQSHKRSTKAKDDNRQKLTAAQLQLLLLTDLFAVDASAGH
eukprot:scaffold40933_cov49-Cyclotella_meneghiniana.AAC.3